MRLNVLGKLIMKYLQVCVKMNNSENVCKS